VQAEPKEEKPKSKKKASKAEKLESVEKVEEQKKMKEPLSLTCEETNLSFELGTKAEIKVNVSSGEVEQCVWYHDNDLVDDRTFKNSRGLSVLTITEVKESSAGRYSCKLVHDDQTASIVLNVTVTGILLHLKCPKSSREKSKILLKVFTI
jgi:hypothetical protein